MNITIFCDGGLLKGGVYWSVGVRGMEEDEHAPLEIHRGESYQYLTSNEAEWLALHDALRTAIRWDQRLAAGFVRCDEARKVQIIMDSQLVVRQFNGRYGCRAPGLIPLWEQGLALGVSLQETGAQLWVDWVSRKVIVKRLGH